VGSSLLRIWNSKGGKRKEVVIFMKFPYNVQGYVVRVERAIILQVSFKLRVKPN
jgi:hypothetical protein